MSIPAVPDFGLGPAPEPGRLDQVAPGVRRLTAPNPGLMTGPGTNTYLIGERDPVVVDPGPADETHTAAIVAAATPLGRIHTIVVTHTHVDHAPGAGALATATGARVVGFGPAEGFTPDEHAGEGWTLRCTGPEGDLTLRALHTPGHASDHLCWLVEENALLLTGDHVMHGSTVVIRPPDGDLHQYLASLARLRDAEPPITTLAPGHGRLMDHVPDVVDALGRPSARPPRACGGHAGRARRRHRRRAAARGLRRRHRAPAPGRPLLAVGPPAPRSARRAGPAPSTRRPERTSSRPAGPRRTSGRSAGWLGRRRRGVLRL